ncbi:MAG: IPT/TIG domain-containing protein [Candidatus Electryoneaceae bacterium]|nr:IPT/TIG domain-containing protein [Candidatus Electryoneaceae bacterium]
MNEDHIKLVGPVEIYVKTFVAWAADPEFSDVSAYSLWCQLEQESLQVKMPQEWAKLFREAYRAPIGHIFTREELDLRGTAVLTGAEALAQAMGLPTTVVTDKSAETPKRRELVIGGRNQEYLWNVIVRQRLEGASAGYFGITIHKANIHVDGESPLSITKEAALPFAIEGVAHTSGTHAGKLGVAWVDYENDTPVISTILPASLSVGDVVVISGSGFGSSEGSSVITFNSGKEVANVLSWADNSISCKIPADATTGSVKITVNGEDSNEVSYTIV